MRQAIAAVAAHRPKADELHLFVAAPCSACLAVGQELQLRNLRSAQTYRFRPGREADVYTEAILLREWPAEGLPRPSPEDIALASRLRTEVWQPALAHVRELTRAMQLERPDAPDWRATMRRIPGLDRLAHLESIPALCKHVDVVRDRIDPTPHTGREYSFDKENRAWRFRDDTILGLWSASEGREDRALQAARLFLFHEYLHDYHGLSKLAATQVGSFPNVLERIDYVADLYAVLHDLEFALRAGMVQDGEPARLHLASAIDLIIRSIAGFQGRYPIERIQERALRRLLNWHWRGAQVRRSASLDAALRVICRHPAIEVSGLVHSAGARRVYVRLDRFDPTTDLALGLLTEAGTFARVVNQAAVDVRELIHGIRLGDHETVRRVISATFEQAGAADAPLR